MRLPLVFSILPAALVLLSSDFAPVAAEPVVLPPPDIAIDRTRSDLGRAVRASNGRYEGPIHDTHVHLDPSKREGMPDFKGILKTARENGVSRLTVMPTPNEGLMGDDGAKLRRRLQAKGREAGVAVRILCGAEYLSVWMEEQARRGFAANAVEKRLKRLAADLDGGGCAGAGEIGLFHFQKWGRQAVIDYAPDFAPFLRAVAVVAEKNLWLDLHAETMEPEGKSREDEVFGLVALLHQRHPGLKLILSHTAMTNTANARALLETYPNLMLNFKLVRNHSKWRNLEPVCDESRALYEDWAQLMEAMPERFLVGTDAKFGRKDFPSRKYRKEIKAMRRALGSLDPNAARLIAWDNAERLFGD